MAQLIKTARAGGTQSPAQGIATDTAHTLQEFIFATPAGICATARRSK